MGKNEFMYLECILFQKYFNTSLIELCYRHLEEILSTQRVGILFSKLRVVVYENFYIQLRRKRWLLRQEQMKTSIRYLFFKENEY